MQRVSLETGIPVEVVSEVTSYQGKYTAEVVKAGLFESVMWPYLGKVIAPPHKVQARNERIGSKVVKDSIQTP